MTCEINQSIIDDMNDADAWADASKNPAFLHDIRAVVEHVIEFQNSLEHGTTH